MVTADLGQPDVMGKRLATGVALAELQDNGTVIVRNVPLMSEVRATDPGVQEGARQPRDRAWLEGALTIAKERAALGKLPIMNRRHYMDSPERCGTYLPTSVELAEVNPNDFRWTIMGDKVYESLTEFDKSKAFDLRSVEVSPDAPFELGALALLRDKESFFKYPLLSERLAPELQEAYRARGSALSQLWQGSPETFSARPSDAGARRRSESHAESRLHQAREDFAAAAAVAQTPVEDFSSRPGESYGARRAREARQAFEDARRGRPAPGPSDADTTPAPLARALETFGQRPDARSLVMETWQEWLAAPASVRAAIPFDTRLLSGNPLLNPRVLESRGGRP